MNKHLFSILMTGFLFYDIGCIDADLLTKVSQLTVAHPFYFFDVQLSQQELDLLQALPIGESTIFQKHETIALDHYGTLDNYEDKVFKYLRSLGCDDERAQQASKIIYKIVHDVLHSLDQPEAWIAIRSFKSTDSYDEPRWHIDEALYKSDCGYAYKVIMALKGPSTLLCDVSPSERTEFFKIKSMASYDRNNNVKSVRSRLASVLRNSLVFSTKKGQAAVFIMGNANFGAIHSEPAINEPRIFMSIVPGSHEQIKELHDKWHKLIANRFR